MNGRESHASYELTTDGKAADEMDGDIRKSSRLYWEGDVLVPAQRRVRYPPKTCFKGSRDSGPRVVGLFEEGGRKPVCAPRV